ncbi:hypothetical protein KO116_P200003 (plasmid) [Halomonas sp. KO116]|nr:hypothetical protein KO116_P200003 [Halomonas sp. KO116]
MTTETITKLLRVLRVIPDKEKRPLIDVLRTDYQRHAHFAELLFYDWPKAKEVAIAMLDYVSLHIRRQDEALALEILCEALSAYSEVAQFARINRNEKVDDALRLAIFVDALVTVSLRDLQIAIETEKGEQWTLPEGVALSKWLAEHDGDLTVYHQPLLDSMPVRAMIYGAITTESVKRILQRADYENAILANRLAISR